ncbi:MAG: peroxide stress protein YaaA [Pseudomonadota bacterium]
MLLLLSPAKTLDYTSPLPPALAMHLDGRAPQQPRYAGQALELIKLLRQQGVDEIAALMALSDKLAELNVARYQAWRRTASPVNSRPALLAFNGDVYEGLQAQTLRAEDLDWAEQHLLILSGLYGLLQPLDALQPYRLEMGTRLANPAGADLYAWWRERVSADLGKRLRVHARAAGRDLAVVLNLASQEYARVVDRAALGALVVDVVFEDWHGGRWKIISFNAKRARGLMARHVIVNRLTRPDELGGFDAEGWAWAPGESTPAQLVFRRDLQGGAGERGGA